MNTQAHPTRKLTRSPRRRQGGNALVWMLLAMVIGGILVATGVQQYSQAERTSSAAGVSTEVQSIIGETKASFGQYAYVGLTTAIAVGGAIIPRRLATGAATANNKYSGAITLVDNNAATQGTALLSYANVPQDECKSIVVATEALARQVQVGGVDVKPLDAALLPATLNAQCIGAAQVPITWTIGRT